MRTMLRAHPAVVLLLAVGGAFSTAWAGLALVAAGSLPY